MLNVITRRTFLERGLQAALGAAAGTWLNVPLCLQRAMAAGAIPKSSRKLLFIFLRGGNDGLNTLIPVADDAYSTVNRPNLFVPKPVLDGSGRCPSNPDLNFAINLGNNFAGLHPGLADVCPLYNAGQFAAIHRVGYSKQSRSHFDSQRYWENGTPRNDFESSGIFYRAVVDTGLHQGRSFPAVSVQSGSPLLLRGPLAMTNLSDPGRYDLLGVANNAGADKQKLIEAIARGHAIPYPAKDYRDLLFTTGRGLQESIEALKNVGVQENNYFDVDGTTHLFPIDAASNQKGFRNSAYDFFDDLKIAAQILAKTDAVITGTQLSGFDTHNGQGGLAGSHPDRMRWLGWGIYALKKFFTDINPAVWDDTLVVTLSEFGRTSKENGSMGTDHAEASVMFVAGGKVKGGVYQCDNSSWVTGQTGSMFQVNSRYLRRSVDYRSILGEIIRDHLGATPEQLKGIIPGYADPRERLEQGGVATDGTSIVGELGLI